MTSPFHHRRIPRHWLLFTLLYTTGVTAQQAVTVQQPQITVNYDAPVRLTIQDAYQLAREHYPQTRQRALLQRTRDYTVANAAKGYLPQLSWSGQATLQSDVTNLPLKISGFTLPTYSKDQYRAYGELDQVVYDGGAIHNQQQAARITEQIQEASLDVDLYPLYDRINQLFFGILLVNEQLRQNEVLQTEIKNDMHQIHALITNGVAYQANLDEMQARLLEADQARTEGATLRKAYLDVLGQFTGLSLDEGSLLETPDHPTLTDSITRPELRLFTYQQKSYDIQDQLANTQWKPRLGVYFQGGYGRPGLNMLSNNFAWYYIGGVRLTWNLGSLYTLKKQKRLNNLGRQTVGIAQETFIFNTRAAQRQDNAGIAQYRALLADDWYIVSLRTNVKNTAEAQMQNGALSVHDYLAQLNAKEEAVETRLLHTIQLLQAEYNYRNLSGQP